MKRFLYVAVVMLMFAPLASHGRDNLHAERKRSARTGLALARSDASYIHLLARGAPGYSPGHNILHTVRDTGEMNILYSSGIIDEPTVHLTFSFKVMLGLFVKDDYLYIADVHSERIAYQPSDSLPHTSADLREYLEGTSVTFRVHAFEIKTGKLIGTHAFSGTPSDASRYKDISPHECLGEGPFRKTETGLQCFDHEFVIKESKLEVKRMENKNTEPKDTLNKK